MDKTLTFEQTYLKMYLALSAIALFLLSLSEANHLHHLPENDTNNAAFQVDFWSGIACSGVHTSNFSGPPRDLSNVLPNFHSCERIPYHGITGAVTFRADKDYFFRLHADSACGDEQVAVGGKCTGRKLCHTLITVMFKAIRRILGSACKRVLLDMLLHGV